MLLEASHCSASKPRNVVTALLFFKKKLYGPFLWMELSHSYNHYEETVYFLPPSPRKSWYSIDQPQKDEMLSQPWSHPVVLNQGPMGGSKDDSAFHHRSFNYSLWLTIMISWSAHVWITRNYNLFFSCVITIKKCGRMILKHFEKDSSYLYHTKPQNIWDFRNDFPLHTT